MTHVGRRCGKHTGGSWSGVLRWMLAALLCGVAVAVAGERASTERLAALLATTRFVTYTPSAFFVRGEEIHEPSAQSIERDLMLLRRDFSGLILYASSGGIEQVPAVAERLGYRALILGIWDPMSETERRTAIDLARRYPRLVAGVAVGNETLLAKRLTWPVLRPVLEQVRAALPDVPITTSEPFAIYLDTNGAEFIAAQDFLLPNVHPRHEPWFASATIDTDVDFVVKIAARLRSATDKPILIKETGLPSAPAEGGFSAQHQAQFWSALQRRLPPQAGRGVAVFEAFDQPWKPEQARAEFGFHSEEAHWGIYRSDREPKPVVEALRKVWAAEPSALAERAAPHEEPAQQKD